MLVAFLSFSGSLETKFMFLNNKSCIIRRTLIDLNPIKVFRFMVTRDKCNGSCNVVDDRSTNICAPDETKNVNVKAFDPVARINEVKILVKHIHVIITDAYY